VLGLLLLAGCVTWRAVPPAPLGDRDGDVVITNRPFRVVVIDGLWRLDRASLRRIRALDPDRIAVSQLVARSSPRRWRRSARVLSTLAPAWPTVGWSDRLGDPKLRGLFAAYPDIGIPVLSEPVAWYGVDVRIDDVRWRWVSTDTHADALGSGWLDERSWIPKAVGDERVDRLVLALDVSVPHDDESDALLRLVRDHAPADELVLIVAFGTQQPGLVAIGGRWGEGRLYTSPLPAGGWWVVDLDASGVRIAAERPLGEPVVHRWSPTTGWLRQSPPTNRGAGKPSD